MSKVLFAPAVIALNDAIKAYKASAMDVAIRVMLGGETDADDLRQAIKETEATFNFATILPNHIDKGVALFTKLLKTHHPDAFLDLGREVVERAREEGLLDMADRIETNLAGAPA